MPAPQDVMRSSLRPRLEAWKRRAGIDDTVESLNSSSSTWLCAGFASAPEFIRRSSLCVLCASVVNAIR